MNYTEKDAISAAKIIFSKAKNAEKIDTGYSHELFEVDTGEGKSVIVRFSNGNDGEHSLEKEIRVNQILFENKLPVPDVILYEKGGKDIPYEFAVLSKLDGEDISDIWEKVNKKDKLELARCIGDLLGRIHRIKFEEFGSIKPQGIDNKYAGFNMKQVGEVHKINHHLGDYFARAFNDIGLLAAHEFIDDRDIVKIVAYLLKRKDMLKEDEKPTLVHGDFEPRNIMAKKEAGKWVITGVLDFEFADSRVREYDFLKLYRAGYMDGGDIREALLEGYGKHQKIRKNFDERVELFRFVRDVGFAAYLLKAGNKKLAEEVLEGGKKIRE